MRSNKKSSMYFFVFVTFALLFMSILFVSINFNNDFDSGLEKELQNNSNLKISSNGESLDFSSMHQNGTAAYRLFESIKFTINASKFTNPNYTKMQIHYSNGIVENFNMEYVPGTDTNFTYIYTPRYYDPLGFQNVSFLIYNLTNNLLSSSAPITNFTIKSNYLLSLNSNRYRRDNIAYAELIVTNEPQPYDFNWNITIVDSDNETIQKNLFDLGNDLNHFSFIIDDRFNFTNDLYYVKINISDTSRNTKAAAYYPFRVLNTIPKIVESSIEFSIDPLKRAEDCILKLNVTDDDPYTIPENVTVSLTIQDATGIQGAPIQLTNHNNWSFTTTFSIAITKPIGRYQMHLTAEDQYGGKDNITKYIEVINNPPEIHGYYINGLNMNQSVSVNYGEDLVFSFDVSDIENTVAYITVSLLDEENNWYNISRKYENGMEITIRTEELITGIWYVYLSVIDIDGAITHLHSDYRFAPQEINIIPDLLTPVLPWIGFAFGVILGVLIGVAILYKKFKTKYIEPKEAPPKKPSKATKIVAPRKPIEKAETERVEAKEREEPAKEPQRKIKRKLK
ncbi:MAG: hypothetical protein ACFFD7_17580 [Candidatus Thorarchaeota archaeon]